MKKFMAVDKLLGRLNNLGSGVEAANMAYVREVRNRLTSGITTTGSMFLPFKDRNRKYDSPRPLYHAAKIFDGAKTTVERSGNTIQASTTLVGTPAQIAHYQGVRRPFLGFSDSDKRRIKEVILGALRRG